MTWPPWRRNVTMLVDMATIYWWKWDLSTLSWRFVCVLPLYLCVFSSEWNISASDIFWLLVWLEIWTHYLELWETRIFSTALWHCRDEKIHFLENWEISLFYLLCLYRNTCQSRLVIWRLFPQWCRPKWVHLALMKTETCELLPTLACRTSSG